MSEIILELRGIEKSFGDTRVLRHIDLCIERGEFITFLGASGCGKTTTLRIISGLEYPDKGRVFLNGADVTDLEPNRREVNTVFQNYALFPHMNVFDNVAYALKIRKVKKKEIQKRVEEMLDLVQLSGFEKRMPSEMSGGQKQRVAIARALANQPNLLLLDEPLGALDLQLRRQMQIELKRLQRKLGITFLYITHDQEEAINMSSRIVVMKDGVFQQIGTPDEIYNHPKTSYVAQFVGNANIIKGIVQEIHNLPEGKAEADIAVGNGMVRTSYPGISALHKHKQVTMAVRSENIELMPAEEKIGLKAEIIEKTFAGGMLRMTMKLQSGEEIIASRHGLDAGYEAGDYVTCSWKPENAILVDWEEQR